ncbi:LPS translocon maturation chaperone LptM [Actinobacillus vicugnae]|nr:lipoprotein [Actinobacillus vicugnae]
MKKLFLVAFIAALGLTACGVKGPLYFPEQAPAQQQSK